MSSIVLFDMEKFITEMQNRSDFFDEHDKTDKAIAYDSAAEFALDCVLHGHNDMNNFKKTHGAIERSGEK